MTAVWKKHKTSIILTAIVLFLFILPFIYASSWGQDKVAEHVAKNKDKPWAQEWQERVGNTHFYLGRYREAGKAYADWMRMWPYSETNTRYPDIHLLWASCLLEEGKKDEAQQAYEEFLATWPDHPKVIEAQKGLVNAKSWR